MVNGDIGCWTVYMLFCESRQRYTIHILYLERASIKKVGATPGHLSDLSTYYRTIFTTEPSETLPDKATIRVT
jgi:hypothetical protein